MYTHIRCQCPKHLPTPKSQGTLWGKTTEKPRNKVASRIILSGVLLVLQESSNVTDTATTTEHLDLNRCAVGLPLDELVPQVRKAGKACQALGVPKVGTLQFLEGAESRSEQQRSWVLR